MNAVIAIASNNPTHEGVRALLGRTRGHLAVIDGALFIADDADSLEEWMTPEPPLDIPLLPPAPTEVIEVETRQVTETTTSVEAGLHIETSTAADSKTDTQTDDAASGGEDQEGVSGSDGDAIDQMDQASPVASRSDVVARIRSRARTYTKTSGVRQTRRSHRGRRDLP